MSDLIQTVLAEPYAGAFHFLRGIDPLYQSEIGTPRAWELKVEVNEHGCDCCYCSETKYVTVEAITAAEAIERGEEDLSKGEWIIGVRVEGSRGPFAEPEQ